MSQPNIIIVMTDQQRADVSRREGFPLDTTPFLDALATQGTWFDRAYTTMPVCLPARVSLLTGRYPSATRARTNHNGEDAYFETDLFDLVREQGYRSALCGKNHSHARADRIDHVFALGHHGGSGDQRTDDEVAFDQYLAGLRMKAGATPAPFGVEVQCPYRAVTDAVRWIDEGPSEQPFFLWLSFPEPHNPYQVPEPYFSMFPPETLPLTQSDETSLAAKGYKYQFLRELGEAAFPDYDEQLVRARSNYLGMLRLIDDQVSRFFDHLDTNNLRDNTIVFFLSDHGDYVGEYGLVRKGAELPEVIARIHGFGGLHYTAEDDYDLQADGLFDVIGFDELNGVSQSGTMRALRCGDWKLIYDMQERGQLYNLANDPVELNNLFDHPDHTDVQSMLLEKLLGWTLRVQDPLPHPRRRYRFKSDERNYWSPYSGKVK